MSEAAETACLKLGNSWNPRKPKSMFLHMQNHSQLANSLFFRIMWWNTFWSSTGAFLFLNTQHFCEICLFVWSGVLWLSCTPTWKLGATKVIVCNRIDLRGNLCLVWWFDINNEDGTCMNFENVIVIVLVLFWLSFISLYPIVKL